MEQAKKYNNRESPALAHVIHYLTERRLRAGVLQCAMLWFVVFRIELPEIGLAGDIRC